MAAQRIAFEPVTHQPAQSFKAFAHICGARCNADVCGCTNAEHLLQPLQHTDRFSECRCIEAFRQLHTSAACQQYGYPRLFAADRLPHFHAQQPRLVCPLAGVPVDVSVQSIQSDAMLLGELTPCESARPELSCKLCGFRAAAVSTDACSALPFGHVSSVRPWTAVRLDVVARTHTDEHRTEPNSGLGKAIQYMLRHWMPLTLFLRVAGAPLDNNVAERALKKAILHRENSLFYKTLHGAEVGDLYMSLIHTCELNGVNSFDYLTELQRHSSELRRAPADWMPWNYRATLARMRPAAAA